MEPVNIRIAGSVQGSLPQVPAVVTNLPSLDAEFTGRATDLAALSDSLRDAPITVVSGLAGVGKTTLALKAATKFHGRTLFVDLDETAGMPLLLAGLGVAQEAIPTDQGAAEVLYRSLLAEQPEPMLLLLDNASSAAQVRPLRPGPGHHRVLVTSRHTLADLNARLIELDVLTTDDSIALITAAVRVRRPDDSRKPTAELVELAGRLPLALSIVAAVLADDVTLSIVELTALLRPPAERLDELDGLRRAFDLSYARLTAAEQRLFRLLSVIPVAEFAVEHVCGMLDVKTRGAQKLLTSLRRAHLLEHGRTRGRFRMHDLLRLYSAEQADPDRGIAWDRLVEHLTVLTDEASDQLDRKALEWLDLEWPLLTNVVERGFELDRHRHVAELVRCVSPFTLFRSSWREWPRLLELGIASAQQVGDRWLEGMLQGQLGTIHLLQGDLAEADPRYAAAMEISQELGDKASQLGTSFNLATLVWQNGDPATAKYVFEGILKMCTAAHAEHDSARALFSLGCIAHDQGDLDEAYERLTTARSMFEEIGDRHSVAMVLTQTGLVLKDDSRCEEALSVLQQARKGAEEAGDVLLEAKATANAALVHGLTDDLENALAAFRRARKLFSRVGDEDNAGKIAGIIAELEQIQLR